MVGIVVVSHSQKLAEGVAELAQAMARDVRIVPAGGLEDGSLGTSFQRIKSAIESVYSEDGVAIFMDMGSAVMTAEAVLEEMPERRIAMVDCPFVEGVILGAVEAAAGASLKTIKDRAEDARFTRKLID